jgi:glycosyltransferase involved in cell wall biosynthesis
MKILIIHNLHRSHEPSGDDAVFEQEQKLLKNKGIKLIVYSKTNDEYDAFSLWQKASMVFRVLMSKQSYYSIKQLIQKEKPDIAHFHNIFPLISPSAYYACSHADVPVVQTLHDYRLLCPMAFFMRRGEICDNCTRYGLWQSIFFRCLRGSLLQTGAAAAMVGIHRLLGTWRKKIDLFICLSNFERNKFLQAGFPADKMVVKPNFLPNPPKPNYSNNDYAIYVGRLGEEKGLKTLLYACKRLPKAKLKILGSGPSENELKQISAALQLDNVEFLGLQTHKQCLNLIRKARFLIMPSEWYETFGLTIIEAFACGKPVIASNLGAMAELVEDGETGLLFEPGNADDLAEKLFFLWHNDNAVKIMGENARSEFEARYTAERNYQLLMGIYQKAINNKKTREIS